MQSLSERAGKSLFTHPEQHSTAAEEIAPPLSISLVGARPPAADMVWLAKGSALQVDVALSGPTAAAFARKPGKLVVFVGDHKAAEQPVTEPKVRLTVPVGAALDPRPLHGELDWQHRCDGREHGSIQDRIGGPCLAPTEPDLRFAGVGP